MNATVLIAIIGFAVLLTGAVVYIVNRIAFSYILTADRLKERKK